MKPQTRWIVALLGALLLATSGLGAISVRPINLEETVRLSGRAFFGRCVEVRDLPREEGGLAVRLYRFLVLEPILNTSAGEIVEFRQVRGGKVAGGIFGMPEYRKGQELLLFLYAESRVGMTSPVGVAQGMFRPVRQADGATAFVNGVGNRNLALNLEAEAVGLAGDEAQALREARPLRLEELRSMVERIRSRQTGVEMR
ncbi:MAG: hypothetical protein Kow00109_08420 [Acidobacteriota bacterium]